MDTQSVVSTSAYQAPGRAADHIRSLATRLGWLHALRRNGCIVFAALCATAPVLAAVPGPECGDHATIAKLIASPEMYDGKALWVVANVVTGLEDMSACPSENERQTKGCLWITLDDGPHSADQDHARYQSKLQTWKRFELQTVAIHATFDKNEGGHLGMWAGGLRNITEVTGSEGDWSFTNNAAVPRTPCADTLGIPQESISPNLRSGDYDAAIARHIDTGTVKLRHGNYGGAIADFSHLVELDPGNKRYYFMRGEARRKNQDYAGAIADCTRAIEIDPQFYAAFVIRGEAKQREGDVKGAAADFARAEKLTTK